MNIHKNAKLTPLGQARMVKMMLNGSAKLAECGQTPARATVLAGVCPRTTSK